MPVHHYAMYWTLVIGLVTGGGGMRFLVYVSKAMPPLKSSAGWWAQLFYNLMKNCSGLDPSSAILSQHTIAAIEGATGMTVPKS